MAYKGPVLGLQGNLTPERRQLVREAIYRWHVAVFPTLYGGKKNVVQKRKA